MIYVYTAITGGFDNLRPPLVDVYNTPGARFICFTDNPLQASVAPWEFRPLPDLRHAARSTRAPKILPHLFLPKDCDVSIWHDANLQLKRQPSKVAELVSGDYAWGAHRHPARDCIYQEADVLLREKIGTRALVEAEVAQYRRIEHPEHFGLWANGFIVRNHARPLVRTVCETWWSLYAAGCERDQLSLPVALRVHVAKGIVATDPADIYRSPYAAYNWHAPWRDKGDNPAFHAAREAMGQRLTELCALTGADVPLWGER